MGVMRRSRKKKSTRNDLAVYGTWSSVLSGTELSFKCTSREQTIEFRAIPTACYDHMIIW